MGRETARDIVIRKSPDLKALRGVKATPSDDPLRHIADDGARFNTLAEMVAHNLSITKKDLGNRTFEQAQNRLYRKA